MRPFKRSIIFVACLLLEPWAPSAAAQTVQGVAGPTEHVFAEAGGMKLKMYVFRPSSSRSAALRAAIVLFHGGGWVSGEPQWAFARAEHFAERGMVASAVQYRLSDEKTGITPIEAMADARAAIRWMRTNAASLGIDPGRIAAYGWSAGGHLAACAAVFDETSAGERVSASPNALILVSPAVSLRADSWAARLLGKRATAADISPDEHVRKGLPPTLVFQGSNDTLTPPAGAKRFCDRMLAAGNACELDDYRGYGHLFTPEGTPDFNWPQPDLGIQADSMVRADGFLRSLGFMPPDPFSLRAIAPRCELTENPFGVDVPAPRLSWKLESDQRGRCQTGYQILVASTRDAADRNSGDLWDSGRVASTETLDIRYGGKALRSSQQAFWKVRVWDQDGAVSAWSWPAQWTMGILDPPDWKASWIGARTESETLLLRRDFRATAELRRAVVHVCGLGQYEMTINGRRVGADLLTPGWTKYDKTCLYDTYDITQFLREGNNALGLLLGNGFYSIKGGRYTKYKGSFGPLKAVAQIRLESYSGATEIIGTDASWRAHAGPITFSCVYGGEDFDARLVQPGWDAPGFAAAGWEPALVVPGPGGALRGGSSSAPPVRAYETLKPVSVKEIRPGVAVHDLGQNAPIMLRLTTRGGAGAIVRVSPAELVKEDGTIDRKSVGGGEAYWRYTLAGSGPEIYASKFFYHGSRYLQVERLPASPDGPLPEVDSLEGIVVHSSAAPIGDFACSNDLFNRVRTLIRWAQRANLMSLISDCPHREKLGWLEQYHLNGPSLRFEWDLGPLFAKTMTDMADSQLPNGLVPDIAPEYTVFNGGFRDSPEWGSAFVIVPWQQYEWTGDSTLLARHYDGMKRYRTYLETKAKDHIVSHGLGDWYDIGPKPPGTAQLTPLALTATAFYYYDTWILEQTSRLLGRTEEAAAFAAKAAAIRAAFNKAFFRPDADTYAESSQTGNAIPLVMGLAEPDRRAGILDAIVADIRRRGNALTSGDVGYRYLLRALADGGRSDVVFDMNSGSDKPGYGYQLKMGATSLTEAWNADPASSQNHFMLGHVIEWFYHDLAGIGPDPAGPGYKKIVIAPQPVGDVTWARASLDSVRGIISAEWKIANGTFSLRVTIPPNTSATVSFPGASVETVTEGGLRVQKAEGIRYRGAEAGRLIFEVESGRYEFAVPWK